MRPIIIGAGRGSRLKALTDEQPKCYAPIGGRRILDWMLEALAEAGLETPIFIGGYRIEQIKTDYPQLVYCHNADWPNNNILASLFCAEEYMADGFVCSYADILYRPAVVERALQHEGDIALCVDTDWRARYVDRSQHPEDDAEKVVAQGDRVLQVNRAIASSEASGEYIGVARFSAEGARSLQEIYHRMKVEYDGKIWKDDTPFAKAYLIHLYQEMLAAGSPFHMVATDGEYMEIDTEEDFELANERWPGEYGV
ncbi:MAG TPA: phosphocholine cytidylyltransferase family protein [Candidatus Latescibacteria bacterium]|nr:phosphocholine cytidylyltransferase family protein [Candidatus Latescibacterota bacterium]